MTKLFVSALGYLALAMAMTWPLMASLDTVTVGYPNVDALDTIMLRGLVPHALTDPESAWVYFPSGFPILSMVPNLVDHLTAWPFIAVFPFPLGDNLWWMTLLAANGLAAHRLGRNCGGTEAAGLMAGILWMLSEPLLREANLHHGPQSMAIAAPLYMDALLTYRRSPTVRRALLAGLWLALAALTYWYFGLFLAVASIPLLWGVSLRHSWALFVFPAGLCLPVLAPLIVDWANAAQHGNDLLFWWRSTPMDTSNRVGLSLVAAALLGGRNWKGPTRRALWLVALTGAIFLLGPALRRGADLWTMNGAPISLPFAWLADLHPVFERLTWPERWGILIPLALIPLAARTRKPMLWAGIFVVETILFSSNLPLETTRLGSQQCWSELRTGEGAVLEIPLSRPGVSAPWVGVHQRFHGRPVVNPMLLPPGVQPPRDWRDWTRHHTIPRGILAIETRQSPPQWTAEDVSTLAEEGVGTIALDKTASQVQQRRLLHHLVPLLGAPVDLGCALVWTLSGDAPEPGPPRSSSSRPTPDLPTLIEPSWAGARR